MASFYSPLCLKRTKQNVTKRNKTEYVLKRKETKRHDCRKRQTNGTLITVLPNKTERFWKHFLTCTVHVHVHRSSFCSPFLRVSRMQGIVGPASLSGSDTREVCCRISPTTQHVELYLTLIAYWSEDCAARRALTLIAWLIVPLFLQRFRRYLSRSILWLHGCAFLLFYNA